MTDKEKYFNELKNSILKKIDDLRGKIESGEPQPESPQNIDLLVSIDDNLEDALNNWYY